VVRQGGEDAGDQHAFGIRSRSTTAAKPFSTTAAAGSSGKAVKSPPRETALTEDGRVSIADDDVPRGLANGSTIRLPLLPDRRGGAPTAVNDRQQPVGLSCTSSIEDPNAQSRTDGTAASYPLE